MDESDDEDIDSVPETSLPSVDTNDSVSQASLTLASDSESE